MARKNRKKKKVPAVQRSVARPNGQPEQALETSPTQRFGEREGIMVPDDKTERSSEGLSGQAYWLFALLFLFLPAVCVILSSVLYYVWIKDQPKQAKQINRLGFIVFGIHLLLFCLIPYLFSLVGGRT
jgi:hypothetical protein